MKQRNIEGLNQEGRKIRRRWRKNKERRNREKLIV